MKRVFYLGLFLLFSVCFCVGQNPIISVIKSPSIEEYKLEPLNKINTLKSEFGAVPYYKGIAFVSEQKQDLVNFETIDVDGHPYLDIFYVDVTNSKNSSKKSFSKKHNSDFHDGPIAFNADFTVAYLTRSSYIRRKNAAFVNQSKLFTLEKKGNNWGKPKSFVYDSDEYSLGHACLSPDGKYLFFSSDMKGGYGATDLYVCEQKNNEWTKPVNLGPKINSAKNELFPHFRKDGTLFFASDSYSGFGGLDIYSANKSGDEWVLIRNEGPGINSSADDFAICFADSTTGYVSSNRNGSDDLFKFVFTKKLKDFEGYILNSKDVFDPSQEIMLELLDSSGNVLNRTRTDKEGYFKFTNLSADSTYYVRVDENDPSFVLNKKMRLNKLNADSSGVNGSNEGDAFFNRKNHFYYADKYNTLLRVTNKKGESNFVFKNLPKDENSFPELDIEDDLMIAGNLFSGQDPVKNAKIVMKDKDGNILDEATTNSFGAFIFSHIPPDESVFLEVIETDGSIPPGTKITITNRSGKTIESITTNENGKFVIRFLSKDSNELKEMNVEDSEVRLDFKAMVYDENDKPIPNLVVFLKDENGKIQDSDTTDAGGKLSFRKLLTDKNYLVEFDESDARLSGFKKIVIKSLKGKVIKEIIRTKEGFTYHILKGDHSELNDLYIDDPWLSVLAFKNVTEKKEINIEEKVYYAYGAYDVDEAGKKILGKVVQIMKENPNISIELISHTDSRGNDDFNMKLSEKRAKASIDFMISNGINKARLKGVGKGETSLKNICGNSVTCGEEEHAQNRRTEFKVVSEKK